MVALSGHDIDCVDDSDCHIPNFGPTRLTYSIPENMGAGNINPMAIPLAMDPDSDDEYLFYTLRDGNAPVENKDRDEAWYEDEDAAAFGIYETSEGLWLNGGITYDFETQREYKLKVVACDNGLNRDHIDVIISVGDVPEPPGVPTIAEVIGVSTTELLVRWSESENTGPPVTYDLQAVPAVPAGRVPGRGLDHSPAEHNRYERHHHRLGPRHRIPSTGNGAE